MRADARPQVRKNRRRSVLHPPAPSVPRHAPSQGNTLRAHGATNKSHHVCARRRDGEAAGTVSGRERRRCCRSFSAVEWYYSDRLLVLVFRCIQRPCPFSPRDLHVIKGSVRPLKVSRLVYLDDNGRRISISAAPPIPSSPGWFLCGP